MSAVMAGSGKTDREILGYSRYRVARCSVLRGLGDQPVRVRLELDLGAHRRHLRVVRSPDRPDVHAVRGLPVGRHAAGRPAAGPVRPALDDGHRRPVLGAGDLLRDARPVLWPRAHGVVHRELLHGLPLQQRRHDRQQVVPRSQRRDGGRHRGRLLVGLDPVHLLDPGHPGDRVEGQLLHRHLRHDGSHHRRLAAGVAGLEGSAQELGPARLGAEDQGGQAPHGARVHALRGAEDVADVAADRLLHPDLRRRVRGDEPDRQVLRQLRLRGCGRDCCGGRHLHRQRLREAEPRLGLGAAGHARTR